MPLQSFIKVLSTCAWNIQLLILDCALFWYQTICVIPDLALLLCDMFFLIMWEDTYGIPSEKSRRRDYTNSMSSNMVNRSCV